MATLYSYAPSGSVNVPVYSPEVGSSVSAARSQSGCQSPGHPIAALWLPGTVTRSPVGAVGAGSVRSVPTTSSRETATAEPSASTETARSSTAVPVGRSRKSANTRGVSSSAVPSATYSPVPTR